MYIYIITSFLEDDKSSISSHTNYVQTEPVQSKKSTESSTIVTPENSRTDPRNAMRASSSKGVGCLYYHTTESRNNFPKSP